MARSNQLDVSFASFLNDEKCTHVISGQLEEQFLSHHQSVMSSLPHGKAIQRLNYIDEFGSSLMQLMVPTLFVLGLFFPLLFALLFHKIRLKIFIQTKKR